MLEEKTLENIRKSIPIFEPVDHSPIAQYRKRAIMKFGEQAVFGPRLADGKSTDLGLKGLTSVKPEEGSKVVAYRYESGTPRPYYEQGQN